MTTDLKSVKKINVISSVVSFFVALGMNFFSDYFFYEITSWSVGKVLWYVAGSLIVAGLVYYLGIRVIRKQGRV